MNDPWPSSRNIEVRQMKPMESIHPINAVYERAACAAIVDAHIEFILKADFWSGTPAHIERDKAGIIGNLATVASQIRARGDTSADEATFAWLIEWPTEWPPTKSGQPPHRPLQSTLTYWEGPGWTHDASRAVRFARRQDAERMAGFIAWATDKGHWEQFGWDQWMRVAEHGWTPADALAKARGDIP